MVEVADHVHKAGALGRLEQQERLQRSSRCMEPRNTERGQMWHPRVQQVTMDFWEWEERTGKKKDEGKKEKERKKRKRKRKKSVVLHITAFNSFSFMHWKNQSFWLILHLIEFVPMIPQLRICFESSLFNGLLSLLTCFPQ